jgi:hypothetical protein
MLHQKEHRLLDEILEDILKEQKRIYDLLNNRLTIMHIRFKTHHKHHNHKEELDMDLNLVLSPTAGALGTPVETKADGTTFTYDPTQIQWSVQDPTIVSFVQNSDGSAQFKPLAVGSTQVGVVDKATSASKTITATVTPGTGTGNVMDITFSNITT